MLWDSRTSGRRWAMVMLFTVGAGSGCLRGGFDARDSDGPARDFPLIDGRTEASQLNDGAGDAPLPLPDGPVELGAPDGALIDKTGLVALYHFDEPSWDGSPGEVGDSSGRGNHGVAVNGASTIVGLLDRAGEFRRDSAQEVDLGDRADLELDPPFSILMWVNLRQLPSVATVTFRIFSKSDATGEQREWAIEISAADDTLALLTSADGSALSDHPIIPFSPSDVDQWVHVAVVASATGNLVGYRNGVLAGTDAITPAIFHGTARAVFGRRNPWGRASDARLDEVAVFTRALPAGEVLAIATAQAGGDPNTEL